MTSVRENLTEINQRILAACNRSERNRSEVEIITVTKYVTIGRMEEAYEAGLRAFGENRLQDALPKLDIFRDLITWHYIGSLQTNKVKDVITRFDYIHSVDRLRLAEEIARQSLKLQIRPKCFIQVNISGEASKHGTSTDEVIHLAKQISLLDGFDVVGLMTMAPLVEESEQTRPIFRRLRELQQLLLELDLKAIKPHYLSMGMSNDYEIAIEEGATHIRIGTALVGNELKK